MLPEGTGAYFAWTIRAPIAAAALGAWFLGLDFFAASPGGLVYNALTGGIGLALVWGIRAERRERGSALPR